MVGVIVVMMVADGVLSETGRTAAAATADRRVVGRGRG